MKHRRIDSLYFNKDFILLSPDWECLLASFNYLMTCILLICGKSHKETKHRSKQQRLFHWSYSSMSVNMPQCRKKKVTKTIATEFHWNNHCSRFHAGKSCLSFTLTELSTKVEFVNCSVQFKLVLHVPWSILHFCLVWSLREYF